MEEGGGGSFKKERLLTTELPDIQQGFGERGRGQGQTETKSEKGGLGVTDCHSQMSREGNRTPQRQGDGRVALEAGKKVPPGSPTNRSVLLFLVGQEWKLNFSWDS